MIRLRLCAMRFLGFSYQSLTRDAAVLCRAVQSVRILCSRFAFTDGVIRCNLIDVERIMKILLAK